MSAQTHWSCGVATLPPPDGFHRSLKTQRVCGLPLDPCHSFLPRIGWRAAKVRWVGCYYREKKHGSFNAPSLFFYAAIARKRCQELIQYWKCWLTNKIRMSVLSNKITAHGSFITDTMIKYYHGIWQPLLTLGLCPVVMMMMMTAARLAGDSPQMLVQFVMRFAVSCFPALISIILVVSPPPPQI